MQFFWNSESLRSAAQHSNMNWHRGGDVCSTDWCGGVAYGSPTRRYKSYSYWDLTASSIEPVIKMPGNKNLLNLCSRCWCGPLTQHNILVCWHVCAADENGHYVDTTNGTGEQYLCNICRILSRLKISFKIPWNMGIVFANGSYF